MAEKLYSYADKQVMDEVGSGGGGDGGSAEPLLLHESESLALDATVQEIYNAFSAGRVVVIFLQDEADPNYGLYDRVATVSFLEHVTGSDVNDGYLVSAGGEAVQWVAVTQNDYPSRL